MTLRNCPDADIATSKGKPLCEKKIRNNGACIENGRKIERFRVEVRLCKLTAFLNICIFSEFTDIVYIVKIRIKNIVGEKNAFAP